MKYLSFFVLFFISAATYSQDDAFDKMAKESCSCINAKKFDFNSKTDLKEIQLGSGVCIIESYSKYKNELSAAQRIEYDGVDGMRKLGFKSATYMVKYCPDVIMAMGKKYLDDQDKATKVEQIIEEPPKVASLMIEGRVASIETNEFVNLKVRDKNNRVYTFYILDYFETAYLFTEKKV